MKRTWIILLAFTICLSFLTSCGGRETYNGEAIELWLVTEESQTIGMNQQAEMVIERFKELYPNVTIRLDILPGSEEARTAYLKKIRSEIMAGDGPDMYLLPTAPQTHSGDEIFSTAYMEPLFGNVCQQMYNGIFTDISAYYDADEELGKDALVTAVMDAGVMDGARYLLPLRYSYDVLAVDMDSVASGAFEEGILALYDLALGLDDYRAAHALNIAPSMGLVSEFVDYETGNVLMDANELTELLESYLQVYALADEENHQDIGYYVNHGELFIVSEEAYPGYHCDIDSYIYSDKKKERIFTTSDYLFVPLELPEVIDAAAAIKMQEENIAMYPIRASDGSLVAEVTYYAAVGSGCEYPETAYEFLRMLYSEELQWEQYSPRNTGRENMSSMEIEGLVEAGFPVRTTGFAEPYFEIIRTRLRTKDELYLEKDPYFGRNRLRQFLKEDFTIMDEDVPVLSVQVDEARFPVITTEGEFFDGYISRLIGGEDPQELAETMIDDLTWALAEG